MTIVTTDQAIKLNAKLAAIINKPNPLGLTDSGQASGGRELTAVVRATLAIIQGMAQRAQDAGRSTPAAREMLQQVEAAFSEHGIS